MARRDRGYGEEKSSRRGGLRGGGAESVKSTRRCTRAVKKKNIHGQYGYTGSMATCLMSETINGAVAGITKYCCWVRVLHKKDVEERKQRPVVKRFGDSEAVKDDAQPQRQFAGIEHNTARPCSRAIRSVSRKVATTISGKDLPSAQAIHIEVGGPFNVSELREHAFAWTVQGFATHAHGYKNHSDDRNARGVWWVFLWNPCVAHPAGDEMFVSYVAK